MAVVAVAFPWRGGELVCIPVMINTTMSAITAATAAAGPAEATGAVVDGLHDGVFAAAHEARMDRLGAVLLEGHRFGGVRHRRRGCGWDNRPPRLGEAHRGRPRDPQGAGREGRFVVAVQVTGDREVRPHLLERVQLAVIMLHGVHVVVGAPAHQHGRGESQHDHHTDDPTHNH